MTFKKYLNHISLCHRIENYNMFFVPNMFISFRDMK